MALKRNFVLNRGGQEIVLPDIDPDMNPDDLRKIYASQYPELMTAAIVYHDPKEGVQQYEFAQKEGGSASVVAGKVEFRPSIGRKA